MLPTRHVYIADGNSDISSVEERVMAFAGADGACSTTAGEGENTAVMVAWHPEMGDQDDGDWTFRANVYADSTDGVVLDEDAGTCSRTADYVGDPTLVRHDAGQYIMFGQMDGDVNAAASGCQCSNFVDDGYVDTYMDYGCDLGCESPTDDAE